MQIAIVTGATGGIGKEFVRELVKETLDEIWVVGRNEQRLIALKKEFGEKIVPICADLTEPGALISIQNLLKEKNVKVSYLVNNAGISKMMASKDFDIAELEETIALNCKVPVVLINICIPFMAKGSRIINMSSASSFQPVPYINLYASTKAFERSYSRALNVELKPLGITSTAVCPSWVDTGMIPKELGGKKVTYPGIVSPAKVAQKAIKDAKKGSDMSICSLYVKCQHFYVKIMPQKLSMKIWMWGIKRYIL